MFLSFFKCSRHFGRRLGQADQGAGQDAKTSRYTFGHLGRLLGPKDQGACHDTKNSRYIVFACWPTSCWSRRGPRGQTLSIPLLVAWLVALFTRLKRGLRLQKVSIQFLVVWSINQGTKYLLEFPNFVLSWVIVANAWTMDVQILLSALHAHP